MDSFFILFLYEPPKSIRIIIATIQFHRAKDQIPAFSLLASISYFDSIKSSRLPMNLIQAQRDCFGEHTFERIDKPGTFHYKDWQN